MQEHEEAKEIDVKQPEVHRERFTEVFENFTLVSLEPESVEVKPMIRVESDISNQPPLSFLQELQEKMRARKQALEHSDKVCFKEFDATSNRFVDVSKEERELKQRVFDEH